MKTLSVLRNEEGSALVVALLVLACLILIGIAATTTTTTDMEIAGNQKFHKMAFYEADAGTEVGIELVEENIDEKDWTDDSDKGNCKIVNGLFYMNTDLGSSEIPSDTNRDVYISKNYATGDPHTNLRMGGNTTLSTGGAVQMICGYGGTGFGTAGAGAWVAYDIRSQHQGHRDTQSVINLVWRHLM